jgi:hypothetical protein
MGGYGGAAAASDTRARRGTDRCIRLICRGELRSSGAKLTRPNVPEASQGNRLASLLWPAASSRFTQVTTAAEVILAVAGIAGGVFGFFGWFDVSSERAAQWLLALGSLVTLSFVVEAGERRRAMNAFDRTQESLSQLLRESPVREVAPGDIQTEIDSLLDRSREWLFRGGSARYLRGSTLPTLANQRTMDVSVVVALLDPRDLTLCEAYSNYRRKIGRTDPGVSDRSIQAEILGTIYSAAWYSAQKRVRARVVLLRSFSQLRYDIGSDGLLVTVADRTKNALFASSDSWYYRSLRDELEQLFHGNPEVVLPPKTRDTQEHYPESVTEATETDVREVLQRTKTVDGASLLSAAAVATEIEWTAVREAVVNPHEPNT